MRNLAAAGRGLLLALLCVTPASAGNPLVGTWSATVDWANQSAGLLFTMQLGADGHVREHVMNHMGMAYDLAGTYQIDAAGKTMHWTWTDYSPKRICLGGNCTAMGAPVPLHVANSARIQIQSANYFIGIGGDGTAMKWIRSH